MERFPEKELDYTTRNGIAIATGTIRSSLVENRCHPFEASVYCKRGSALNATPSFAIL